MHVTLIPARFTAYTTAKSGNAIQDSAVNRECVYSLVRLIVDQIDK